MEWTSTFSTLSSESNTEVPELAFTHLASWGAITLVGDDKKSYLQGQVTCDVVSLAAEESVLGAHCDAKGKVWSIFRLFNHNSGYALFQPLKSIEVALKEIKKYSVFSKVDIEITSDIAFGIVGSKADDWINQHFDGAGDVRQSDLGSAVKVDAQRWLLLIANTAVESLFTLTNGVNRVNETIWQRLDIESVTPFINEDIQGEHIPQAFNLQATKGISFTKGCYTGQETVARAKYRGMNKRATYLVSTDAEVAPSSDIALERSVGENWRSAGTLISQYSFVNGKTIGLIILPNNLDETTQLRSTSMPEAIWSIEPLPYSLDDEQ